MDEKIFVQERSVKINRVESYLKKWHIDDRGNPVDAINDLLWMHELTWKDINEDEKLQGLISHAVMSEIKCLDRGELYETNPWGWEALLTQKCEKWCKPNVEKDKVYNGAGPWTMRPKQGKWSGPRRSNPHYY